ncbi:phage major capsid protein [Pantoea sp. Al-1710]|uniref:Phage major capsid protein n=1 Tax=Candidatus Pantoea communis TaxID=2608354 RepID=A0ABX0RI40_9GAMM|nr:MULTISPECIES: phage major capsid protein [Pantoea]NIG13013.1 phage major capsid protein [Pantoea sp. Cy-640]NIG17286.1 phage major capsid protein [Pantoea communis]
MNHQRAVSLLQLKAVNENTRTITGIATTPTPDRYGDIVMPDGAQFNLPIPLLWQHDHLSPIGQVTSARVTDAGIEIKAQLAQADAPSQLAARLDEAWQSIRLGLVKGLSIGFRPIEYSYLDDDGIRFSSWEWYELSVVTVPANAEGSISNVKTIDQELRAASGKPPIPALPTHRVVHLNSPAGASAFMTKSITQNKEKPMNIGEQIKSFEAKRASLDAERADVMQKAFDEGRTLDLEETDKYDELTGEVKSLDSHLNRLRDLEQQKATTAKPVQPAAGGDTVTTTKAVTPPNIIHVEKPLEKGIGFARMAKLLAASKGLKSEAATLAKYQYPDDIKLQSVMKDLISAGSTSDPNWAGNLVTVQDYTADFIDFLRPQTIIGRFGAGGIPGLTRIPFNVRIKGQTSGGAANWVGEGKAKPLTSFDFSQITLGFTKVAAIAVLTDEVIRLSTPSADSLVRQSLADAVIERLDEDFIDPDKTAVDGVSPASITNGAASSASTGVPDQDANTALSVFIDANLSPTGAVWLMSSTTALTLSQRKNALGQREYPDMTMFGGTFNGLPVIVSQYIDNSLILVDAPNIYLADDGAVAIDISTEASLEMQSTPTHDSITPTPIELVSMFQTNSVAVRAERWINWQRRRDAAVSVITDVDYSVTAGS